MATAYLHMKYGDPEYDDNTIEALMQYFKIDRYSELVDFFVLTKKRSP
jgi:hypothetical protein